MVIIALMRRTKPLSEIISDGGFAQRLRQIRRQKNLSQADLAELVDVHSTHITRYERGMSRPSADTLKRLADALGVSGDYLLNGLSAITTETPIEDTEVLIRFKEVEKMPDDDKAIILKLIDAFIAKKQLDILIAR